MAHRSGSRGARTPRMFRASALLVAGSLALAACAQGSANPDVSVAGQESPAPAPVELEPATAGPREDVPSALDRADDPDLPVPLVDPERIISGGPPPDGIPAIDAPLFQRAGEVDWIADDEPVIALDVEGAQRAYPVQIMHWHEIVNDTVAGRPIAITYCPLCNTALAFDRRVSDRVLSFGTSGSLYLSALVMYDRQTESLWSQVERTAIAGVLAGTELGLVPVTMIRWADWRAAFPAGWVLSRETGFVRDYGTNPYVDYDDLANDGTFLDQAADQRFPAKERVISFPEAASPVAVLAADLVDVGVTRIEVDGRPVVIFSSPGLASALGARAIAEGAPITATGAFRPDLDGRDLTFQPILGATPATADGAAVARDDQTGSQWDLLGRATDGPLAGAHLTPVVHLNTFWFAQAAFRPDTTVLRLLP